MVEMAPDNDWWLVKEPTVDGTVVTIGLLSDSLAVWGHLLFLDLPMVGAYLHQGDFFVSIEAEKTITFAASPVTGKVVAVNPQLNGWVDAGARGDEWLMKLLITD